jgi:hypothetical protein
MKKHLSIYLKKLVDEYRERFVLGTSSLGVALQPVVSINQNQQQQQRFLFKQGRPR